MAMSMRAIVRSAVFRVPSTSRFRDNCSVFSSWCKPHLTRLAPEGWQRDHQPLPAVRLGPALRDTPDQSVSAKKSRAVWARLLAKVYEVDPLCCIRCGSPMRVLAIITDPQQCRRILPHLIKTGAAPPGLDPASLN
jgi:hypothetical protein